MRSIFNYEKESVRRMERKNVSIDSELYEKILFLKNGQTLDQFLSILINRYKPEDLSESDEYRFATAEDKGFMSNKVSLVRKDQNLEKFKS